MSESCDRIVRGLRSEGVRVDVVHLTRHVTSPRVEEQEGGRYRAWPLGEDAEHDLNLLWNALSADPGAARATHLVAFGGALPLFAAPVLAAWLRLPLVTMLRGNDFDTAVFSPRRRPALLEALRSSALVCAVSSDKVAKAESLVPGVRVEWTPNGIDLDRFALMDADRERGAAWRREEVAPDRRVIALFGQLKRKKGAAFLVDCLERSGLVGRAHLLVAGEPDPETEAALERSSAPHTRLPFLQRYDLLPYYAASDVVAIPSFYDGMPNVLLEASALGVPVLAATAGGVPDVLEDGTSGILFEPGDAEACAEAIRRALSAGEEDLLATAERARELVRERFERRAETARYLELLGSLVPAGR